MTQKKKTEQVHQSIQTCKVIGTLIWARSGAQLFALLKVSRVYIPNTYPFYVSHDEFDCAATIRSRIRRYP